MRLRFVAALVLWSGAGWAADAPSTNNQLATLTVEQAEALVKTKGFLEIPGLVSLDLPAAKVLGQKKDGVSLPGLRKITPDVARALAETKALALPGLLEITPDVASGLRGVGGGWLVLDGLTVIDAQVAKELARSEGTLQLNGLTSISPEIAENLGRHVGLLGLSGLTELSAESARGLGKHTGQLGLNGLTSLSKEAAAGLAAHTDGPRMLKKGLWLNGITELSTDAALALASHTGVLGMYGLKRLSPDTVRALIQHKGKLDLWKLPTPDPETLEILATRKADIVLPKAVMDQIDLLTNAAHELHPLVLEEWLTDLLESKKDRVMLSALEPQESYFFLKAGESPPLIKYKNRLSQNALWAHPINVKQPGSRYVFRVPENANTLRGVAVVNQGQIRSQSPLTFKILDGNGKLLWSTGSKPLSMGGDGRPFSIALEPGGLVYLEVHGNGHYGQSHAAWFEPQFVIELGPLVEPKTLALSFSETSQGLRVEKVVSSEGLGYALGLREGDEIYVVGGKYKPREVDLRAALEELQEEAEPFELRWRRLVPEDGKKVERLLVTVKMLKDLIEKQRTEKELKEARAKEKLLCSDGRRLTRAQINEVNQRWLERAARIILESDGDQEFLFNLQQAQNVLPALAEAIRTGNESKAVDLINQVARLQMGGLIGQLIRRVNADGVLYDIGDGKAATGEEVWEMAIARWANAISPPSR